MKNIIGYDNMIIVNNTEIIIYSTILQNCSTQNFTIFKIDNSSFYLENTQFNDLNSNVMDSSRGFIRINNCFSTNFNSFTLENDYYLKLEGNVSFIINNSSFKNLYNFAKVRNVF